MSTPRDGEFDVVVVGLGGAGTCAAIQAASEGASVLVLERFEGGGATRRSGGIVYLGGGSPTQRAAGFEDDPEQMARYLRAELGDSVPDEWLRAFCAESLDQVRWLGELGVSFPERFFDGKATQPPDGFGIFFSGNERQFAGSARPAPRGHVPQGAGMAGGPLFEKLRAAVLARGVDVRCHARVTGLHVDGAGRVIAVEVRELPPSPALRLLHRSLAQLMVVNVGLASAIERLEQRVGRTYTVRVRGGVVIAAGGFVFNPEMMKQHAPQYAECMRLGSAGDDGSGLRLGESVGGALEAMGSCTAWRFYSPPQAFVHGLLVNGRGERLCDESLYGAKLARYIAAQPDAAAYLVIDEKIARDVRAELGEERLRDFPLGEVVRGKRNAVIFAKASSFTNLNVNRKKARTLAALSLRCRMPQGSLQRTVTTYNDRLAAGQPDELGKGGRFLGGPLLEPPFYAIDCRLASKLFPAPCMTTGGLRTDWRTAQVLRADGSPIAGLYAAGRSAVGICSTSYVTGLSIADCIFSGRNAGLAAARAARTPRPARAQELADVD
jgi:3-oxo-5alpha-steroid 4-dehydrogenase